MTKDLHIADFAYPLPDERIAKHPLDDRAACRLLVADVSTPEPRIDDHIFAELPNLLPEGAILVANNARVINARLQFRKPTGAVIEVFLLEPYEPTDYALMFQSSGPVEWKCLVGNSKRWKSGPLTKELNVADRTVTLTAERSQETGPEVVRLSWDDPTLTTADIIAAAGYIPIPPYLNRASEQRDADDYQTVYSAIAGSVAAPTAGLHFTDEILRQLEEHGVHHRYLTLHVGAGTFRPVKSATIGEHDMHSEVFSVSRTLLRELIAQKEAGRPIVAVGTTSVRTLESLPWFGLKAMRGDDMTRLDQWTPYNKDNVLKDPTPVGSTSTLRAPLSTIASLRALLDYMEQHGLETFTAQTAIMIAPGYTWQLVDAMVTNFHQPESTLLLLIASFLQPDSEQPTLWRRLYDHALRAHYRFLSYGDACLFLRNHKTKIP